MPPTTNNNNTPGISSNSGGGGGGGGGGYPLTNILHPGVNDILCGRGGATNAHPGNIKFRKLVAAHKLRYLAATKCDKPAVAKDVVREWRAMDPPGRFLAKMVDSSAKSSKGDDSKNGEDNNNSSKSPPDYWYDIGDKKAREKASQCLRERNGAANEVVANLVKAVTATGEACPEDYATLIHKASAVIQAQQQQQHQGQNGLIDNDAMMFQTQQLQQQQQQQMTMEGDQSSGQLQDSNHSRGGYGTGTGTGLNMVGSYHHGKKSSSPGLGNNSNNNNNYQDNSSGNGNPLATEDDLIEAELQRLLKMKQQQNNNYTGNSIIGGDGGGGGGGGGSGFNGRGFANIRSSAILSNDDTMPTPYMGEESVMREYENLMRKQREIDRMRGALHDVATTSIGGGGGGGGLGNVSGAICGIVGNDNNTNQYGMMFHGGGGGGGGGGGMNQYSNSMGRGGMLNVNNQSGGGNNNMFNAMINNVNNPNMMMGNNMSTNNNIYNNSNMRGGGGENNNYNTGMGNYNNPGGGSTGRNMPSSGNHIPDAAKDYINRLRMLRQEGGGGGGGGGGGRMNTMGNTSGFDGLGRSGGDQSEFVEEYQASLQQFLSHNGDFGVGSNIDGNSSGRDCRKASRKFSETTRRAGGNSSSAEPQQPTGRQQLDTVTCIQIPTNLEDGHGSYNRRGGGAGTGAGTGNRRPSRDDSYLPTLRRNTFGSMDSFSRPSFQSMDDIDMRESFKSVNTMDLMSIGCSINEVYDEDVKINSENWKKYRRRMSAASQVDHTNFGASHLTGLTGLTGLTDYGSLSRPEEGSGFGVTSRVVQTKDCDGPSKNTRGSQMSMVLNLDDPEDCMRLSFASVLSELSDFKE